ncbi:outer-membrane lipoprotein carrier protein LolA [Candidatus Pelagibacter sp.]|nr:outer-membrane lipoprotein carrier protein LolA [Candidatus Pelagibacter sp.]
MFKILIVFFILNFNNLAFGTIKQKIISKLDQSSSLSFNFKQTINTNNEIGKCVIQYPKKIYCVYDNNNKKILVSDGKSLVIKNRNSGTYYRYPLKKTPLNFLLDKDYLIKKIMNSKFRDVKNKYINFKLFEDGNEINIYFDKNNYNLIGWQTEDIYQNLVITFISSIKTNIKFEEKIFILPEQNQ